MLSIITRPMTTSWPCIASGRNWWRQCTVYFDDQFTEQSRLSAPARHDSFVPQYQPDMTDSGCMTRPVTPFSLQSPFSVRESVIACRRPVRACHLLCKHCSWRGSHTVTQARHSVGRVPTAPTICCALLPGTNSACGGEMESCLLELWNHSSPSQNTDVASHDIWEV